MSRISPVLDRLIGIEDPDELMVQIIEVVNDTISPPQEGQFFIFSYQPIINRQIRCTSSGSSH